MKFLLITALSILFTVKALGQSQPDTNGFTDKAEASNKLVNGLKDGKWVEYLDRSFNSVDNDNTAYYSLTIYHAGQPAGIKRYYYISSALYIVLPYNNGKENGAQKTYYENGTLKREKTYKDGLETGVEKFYYPIGKLKREMTYINDSAISENDYDINGNKLNYTNGFTDKTEAKNAMTDGVKDGKWIEYGDKDFHPSDDANSPYYTLTCYNSGEPTGIVRWYYKSGAIYIERPYFNGLANGRQKTYYENGKLKREKTLKNESEVGVEKLYYENGNIKLETIYKNGKIWSKINYDENGNVLH